jgi:hypothetical protein
MGKKMTSERFEQIIQTECSAAVKKLETALNCMEALTQRENSVVIGSMDDYRFRVLLEAQSHLSLASDFVEHAQGIMRELQA